VSRGLTNTDASLRHFWHPVALDADVPDGHPHAFTLLGERWVLVRLAGDLVAMRDRCPHRLVPISRGRVVDDTVVIDECREQARRFFHQPDEVKAAVAMRGDAYRGRVGQGLESNAATYGVATAPDLKETYAFGPVDLPDDSLRERDPRWYAPNVWPASPPGFQEACEAWWRAARTLSDELLDLLSSALAMPHSHLRDLSAAQTSQVSINWYGPRGAGEPLTDQFRIGPHTDFGMLTVLDREPGMGGLQVLYEAGGWIDAPVVPGSLIINTGDLIRRWTDERWCSNEHRVLPPPPERPQKELSSLVFLGEPSLDVVVEAFPSCVSSEHPAQYPPVLSHAYLGQKMDALAVG
jgi:isopenicillin N synthase-like dioxygenase